MSRTIKRPYTRSKRFDATCRNHGACPWCRRNRLFAALRQAPIVGLILLAASLAGCNQLFPLPPDVIVVPVDPTPTPITGVAWVIVIEETAERTPEIAAIHADPFWATVKSRWYDGDSPDAASAVKATSGIKRPCLLLIDAKGKKLFAGPLPETVAAIKARIGGAH